MRLTDEDVQRHKENKYSVECVKGKVKMSDGDIIGNLLDTIEALQLENEQLSKQLDNRLKYVEEGNRCIEILTDKNEQLQAQNGAMRAALEQVQHDIDGAECRDDLDGIKGYIDDTLSSTPTTYHNPADVEALKQAREALRNISNYLYDILPVGKLTPEQADFVWKINDGKKIADEAIAAIDKVIGGRGDV